MRNAVGDERERASRAARILHCFIILLLSEAWLMGTQINVWVHILHALNIARLRTAAACALLLLSEDDVRLHEDVDSGMQPWTSDARTGDFGRTHWGFQTHA